MKKIKVQMLLYILTKNFMEIQKNMLNAIGMVLFYKVVGWFDGQNIDVETKQIKVQSLLPTYIM
jgi:hypothetical protein